MDPAFEARDLGLDGDGFQRVALVTSYQEGPPEKFPLRVLAPKLPAQRVLYVLPVNPGLDRPWGDGLIEIQKLGLHERHGLLCVAPAFATWPWYADRPGKSGIRQESFLLKAVLPWVEDRFGMPQDASSRLLLGFSKSGFGAFSLLLRHPEIFGRAAAWDAPFYKDEPNQYKMDEVFASKEHLAEHFVPRLVRERAALLRAQTRLAVLGHDVFGEDMRKLHELLEELTIPHYYANDIQRKHAWDSGWIEEAVNFLSHP